MPVPFPCVNITGFYLFDYVCSIIFLDLSRSHTLIQPFLRMVFQKLTLRRTILTRGLAVSLTEFVGLMHSGSTHTEEVGHSHVT